MYPTTRMPLLRPFALVLFATLATVAAAQAQSQRSASESSSNDFALIASEGLSGGSSAAAGGSAMHNGDWKNYLANHYTFEVGAGFNAPIGNDTPYITWGGNLTVGGGLRFNKRLSLLTEYQFIDDKLPGSLIAAVSNGTQGAGGNAHIWSFTMAPVVDLFPKRTNSIYLTGGGGFYRKLTSFTAQECCDYYGYAESVVAAHFSSNQGGANFGFGLTHRIGGVYGDGKSQVFAEARYLFLNSPPITASNGLGTTELIPVTVGFRF
jgi:hypothetical protein